MMNHFINQNNKMGLINLAQRNTVMIGTANQHKIDAKNIRRNITGSIQMDNYPNMNQDQFKYEKYTFPHRKWTQNELDIDINHEPPETLSDKAALLSVKILRSSWDLFSGYTLGKTYGLINWNENMWLRRVIFLESVAGVPGYVFAMLRHLKSLRRLERDRGWINSLLSEAENERMHLLTTMKLYNPGYLFRFGVIMAQGIMCNFLFLSYIINPRYCHRFVGYLEEEACITYTNLLNDINDNKLPRFNEECSQLAKEYWKLNNNATWGDVFYHIRADEAHHRDVNHTLAPLSKDNKAVNPYRHELITNQ